MRRAALEVLVAIALAGLLPASVHAAEEGEDDSDAPAVQSAPKKKPQDAAAALVRAVAAYEYGDINQMVDSARLITEGELSATPAEQAQALRLLGIGLYLTNRPAGAEAAFTALLRREPGARLDPTSTRPEVVAFFENLRRQQRMEEHSSRKLIWNFIPPVGQFQNEDNVKGWIVLAVGVASAATAATSYALLKKWQHHTADGGEWFDDTSKADRVKAIHWIAVGALAATYIYGVFDGLIGYGKPLEDSKPSFSLRLTPDGLGFTF